MISARCIHFVYALHHAQHERASEHSWVLFCARSSLVFLVILFFFLRVFMCVKACSTYYRRFFDHIDGS